MCSPYEYPVTVSNRKLCSSTRQIDGFYDNSICKSVSCPISTTSTSANLTAENCSDLTIFLLLGIGAAIIIFWIFSMALKWCQKIRKEISEYRNFRSTKTQLVTVGDEIGEEESKNPLDV
ncbi:unnamed protein product [Caenorhabditis brenneri]